MLVRLFILVLLTTLNFEYLINQTQSTLLFILALMIQFTLLYTLIYLPIKKHLL
mgnify:CR=1 FL=1